MKILFFIVLVVLIYFLEPSNSKALKIKVRERERSPVKKCHKKSVKCSLLMIGGMYHIGEISVGTPKQKIKVLFDTGSTDTWVASSTICKSDRAYCRRHKTYDQSRSKTFDKTYKSKSWSIEYFDGIVSGITARDNIGIGGMVIKNQIFAEASSFTIQDDLNAGIFGLGLISGSDIPADPPFVNMVKQKLVDEAVFAFYFGRGNSISELHFGSADSSHYIPPLIYTPVTAKDVWEIKVDAVLVNGKVVASNLNAIVDSGASHIAGPPKIMNPILDTINKRHSTGLVYAECSKIKNFPNVTFVISKHNFVLTPDDYIAHKQRRCESGFAAETGLEELLLGTVWMTIYYTVFDQHQAKPRLGFARAKK